MSIETLAVLGSGTMGRGIAYVAAVAGYRTLVHDVSTEALERALAQIRRDLDEGVSRGKVTAEAAQGAMARLETAPALADAATRADFVIEAVPEDMTLKLRIFAELDERCREDVVLATNTSALSVTEIAASARRARRVLGMHFFNPVPKMKLVEIVRGLETDDAAIQATREVAERMGKETVLVKESPGFITSRINAMIGNEAFSMPLPRARRRSRRLPHTDLRGHGTGVLRTPRGARKATPAARPAPSRSCREPPPTCGSTLTSTPSSWTAPGTSRRGSSSSGGSGISGRARSATCSIARSGVSSSIFAGAACFG